MSFRVPFSNVVWTKKLKKETTNLFCDIKNKTSNCAEAYALLQIFIISRVKTELKSLPFCLHRIFWCQTADEHQIRLVKHIHLRKKSSWNDPWQIQFTRLFSYFQYSSDYTSLFSLPSLLPSPDTHFPTMFCRLQFIDQRWFPSSLSCHISWLDPYHESWKFQTCGNMANELRNNLRKLPWDNKEEVWFVVLQCKHSSSGARGVLNAFCAYGECSISFQIWWLGTYKTGTLLNH